MHILQRLSVTQEAVCSLDIHDVVQVTAIVLDWSQDPGAVMGSILQFPIDPKYR